MRKTKRKDKEQKTERKHNGENNIKKKKEIT